LPASARDFAQVFATCLGALLDDPDTALGLFLCDLSDGLDLHEAYAAVYETVARSTNKLLVVMTNYSAFVPLSRLAHELGPQIAEMDLNPVLVSPTGVIAVDCLIIPRGARHAGQNHGI
jgi:hypothetical protein